MADGDQAGTERSERDHADDRANGAATAEPELDLSYGDALSELDEILAELESSAVDVDVLAERVARGAVLVRFCRNRLHTVRTDVEAVVDGLLDDDRPETPDPGGAAGVGGPTNEIEG